MTKPRVGSEIFSSLSDVFVSLPTGSGKSLCFCLLPEAFDFVWQRIDSTQSVVVVVSPLIALMQGQVRAMKELGPKAVYAGMVNDEPELSIYSGDFQLVFSSPESLIMDGRWRDMLLGSVYQERLVEFEKVNKLT